MSDDTITTVTVKREDGLQHSTTAVTPRESQPNVRVLVMHWSQVLLFRSARAYMTALSGFMGVVTLGVMPAAIASMMPTEFAGKLWLAMQMAVAPAVMSIIINGLELLNKLDEKFPRMRA